jgi:hypothetical protein
LMIGLLGDSMIGKDQHNNRMQSDFGKLRSPQPLMRGVMRTVQFCILIP